MKEPLSQPIICKKCFRTLEIMGRIPWTVKHGMTQIAFCKFDRLLCVEYENDTKLHWMMLR